MRVPQILRVGCAGAALIFIAALTSVGLYAMVAGGLSWASVSARSALNGAPVLVTIQAAPATATSAITAATPTPGPAIPHLSVAGPTAAPPSTGQPPALTGPGPALTAPAPAVLAAPAPAESRPAASATPGPAQTTPTLAAPLPSSTPRPDATGAPAQADPAQRVAHEGLSLEVVEVARGWEATAPDGSPVKRRDGAELMTVQVRLANETSELRYVADSDLVLVADDGARLAPKQASPQREPHLLTVPVAPRDSVRGWLTFEVPQGLEPKRLQWSPTRPDRPRADATYLLPLP